MEIKIDTKRDVFEFPDYIETHGASPNQIVEQCRSYLKENENIIQNRGTLEMVFYGKNSTTNTFFKFY